MKYLFPIAPTEPEPVGKRTIKRTQYGNLKGYVGGRYWTTFGDSYSISAEREAEEWLAREVRK